MDNPRELYRSSFAGINAGFCLGRAQRACHEIAVGYHAANTMHCNVLWIETAETVLAENSQIVARIRL